jgi:chorismate mutase
MFDIQPLVSSQNYTPLLIAGPCSAESREQVLETALQLSEKPMISLFRCGVWKPRSSPHSFEGCGEQALSWLQEVEQSYHIPTCIEIAIPQHLEIALKHNIRYFWIGARTSVNPFMVQAIADAAKGSDVSIMIKNPISPDLHLWIGAFERLAKAGIKKMASIHRGFSTYEHSIYRNNPLWNIPIEFKRRHPEIPMLCDPSHMAGNKDFIFEIAQKALYMDVNGLMIEVHVDPIQALSDKNQQLKPTEFFDLITQLRIPSLTEKKDKQLKTYRDMIDELDKDLCALLASRLEIVEKIAYYKKEKNISLLQINRWQEVIDHVLQQSDYWHLNKDFMQKLMEVLHEETIKIQEEIIKVKK